MELYKDCSYSPEERADDLLNRLSLDEKMAQIAGLICRPVLTKEEAEPLRRMFPHGAGQVSALVMGGLHAVKDARKMQRILQTMVMEQSEHHIPAVFHLEGLSGAWVAGGMSFPSGIGRGASFDPELEEKVGAITARQELAVGITQILCPVLDIARDPRHGRHGEAYGEDPTLAAAMGSANVRGIQGQEVYGLHAEACAKHYMAYHMSAGGINSAHTQIGPRALREIHGKPFQAAIAKSELRAVMPCYNAVDDGPVSASPEFLTEILRGEMGFKGTVLSDYGAVSNVHTVHYVGETMEEAGYRCLTAGMDVELPMPVAFGTGLKQMFAEGRADMAVLDRAVKRVLTEKFRMGLFEHPFGLEEEAFDAVYQSEEDHRVSLQSARESLVLLKNNGVLPLKKKCKKAALIGPHANWANHYFGGYSALSGAEASAAASNSQAGIAENDASNARGAVLIPGTQVQFSETEIFKQQLDWVKTDCPTLLTCLQKALPDTEVVYAHGYQIVGDNRDEFAEALEVCKDADVILLTLGGKNGGGSVSTMGEGVDSADINIAGCQDSFIREAAKLGHPMVGIHFDGRPVSSDAADQYLDAILEAWNPAEYAAQAVTEVLCGQVNPSGKMPVTTARCAGQIPVYYNHPNGSSWHQGESCGFRNYVDIPHEPRYYFGHGLSYTTFSYSNLKVNGSEQEAQPVSPKEKVMISCDITNTGKLAGTEIVQLYLKDTFASMLRPVQELQGFARVALEPGETKTVTFACAPSQMAFLTRDMRWKVEAGKIEVFIGASSVDLRLQNSFIITEDDFPVGREREFWAEVQIV
ncbi:glycoside hydrolase family 3 N-terminal domain-containing protein [Lachnotalea sp. AF33-28]|uniref:glycoside hydrolase family 3 N-terminal domain-containing protein n=1 Tax=Lachnotalea sp. AF33-28 TaxID=2292046 RepID=UPI000E51751C|nr:glycoside hydrolase family 3 N-terminal domain-containing protein [Lachnotalea sp. AF33-28]RHP34337.1 beta-glucosidase [Lachnotalea sp. AF33-28]